MSMMALGVKANEYFIPVKCIIDVSNSLSEEDEEEINDEDYGIDGLYHAKEILERTLGEVDGYQSDDGILEHKCAIRAVKKLYKML